ncbi:MAG: tetratricopeptide repeat protein, partial [Acidobacteria bacterium]|nr:tetratricopeptide repeat protein [Acidobacteriota bacterium]
RSLEIPQRIELADSVAEVTTSSYGAWRLFSEGRQLCARSRWQEARPLLEEAISLDPEFALAFADLGNLHKNLGNDGAARHFAGLALEHSDRLPVQQRYFVEGEYFSATWAGYGRAIEAYRRGLEIFPKDLGLRNNLASHLAYLEAYDEAGREYQTLLELGDDYGGTFHGAATVQGALGRFEAGEEILSAALRRSPEDWYLQLALGWYLTEWGRYGEAEEHLRRAGGLAPDDEYVDQGWWRLAILRENWQGARDHGRRMSGSKTSYGRWLGAVSAAWTDLYGGRSQSALESLAEAARAYGEPEANTALSHCWRARLALQTGRGGVALEAARQAQREAPGDWPELEGMFLEALAHQALGRPSSADRILEELRKRAEEMPNPVQERQLRHLAGRLALARGDSGLALRELRSAAELLPPRGFWFHWHVLPDHVPLWYALGEAEAAAGRPEGAVEWFRKVADCGAEHLEHPVLFVRSFYQLGRVYEALEERGRAEEAYRRFLGYWGSGDLDREEIGIAGKWSPSDAWINSPKAFPWARASIPGPGAAGLPPNHPP